MASLGISPTFGPSLLIPTNPAFSSLDSAPKGGILLNPRRESDVSAPDSPALAALAVDSTAASIRRSSERSESPSTPISPVEMAAAPLASSSPVPHIRFAPLPDPRRPRSLSTGRNIQMVPVEGADGEITRSIEIRGVRPDIEYDDEALAITDAEQGEESDDEDGGDKKRRWSKSMTMGMGTVPGWRGTMKLLGMKEERKDEAYTEGAPLRKSVSTGGLIGTSPFRWTAETERKRSMQGPPVPSVSSRLDASSSVPTHRRNSSLDPPGTSSLSSSPQPVRMLNGRVYGSRRASEAAERQKEYKERIEPKFVEWGFGKEGSGGIGSNSTGGRSLLGDAEEGSGMEWVKKRREERQKRIEAEKRAAEERRVAAGEDDVETTADNSLNSSQSSPLTSPATPINIITPHGNTAPLPPTPVIQVIEPDTPGVHTAHVNPLSPIIGEGTRLGSSAPSKIEGLEREHITQAIQVPRRGDAGQRDVFDEDDDESDEDEEEEVEDEEEDGDFDDDEEEEEAVRTTSSAAGVEVVSRHKS